jgi:hypothetical protein
VLSGPRLNREELLRDSQATMREIQEVLCDLWEIQEMEGSGVSDGDRQAHPCSQEEDLLRVLTSTHREVQALRAGIGTLQDLLPSAFADAGHGPPGTVRSEIPNRERSTRISEILVDAQTRLDRLALEFENQGVSPE